MRRLALAALAAIALLPLRVSAGSEAPRVVSVIDGDSFWLRAPDGARTEVRLAEIDAPEAAQPYGADARRELAQLVARKTIRMESEGLDRYGRTLARVYVGKIDVNAELVERGAAWVYRKYLRDQSLVPLEAAARKEGRGLWALPASERVPPWKWRRARPREPAPSHSARGR